MLFEGDCSLKLREARFTDAGLYESFLITEHKRRMMRSFIKSVQLTVTDHKSSQTLLVGQDFSLSLYTSQASTVIFQASKDQEEATKWERGNAQGSKWRMEAGDRKLILPRLKRSDAGMYKVLDADGLAISTTLLIVQGEIFQTLVFQRLCLNKILFIFVPLIVHTFFSYIAAISCSLYCEHQPGNIHILSAVVPQNPGNKMQ
uniref:Immunoglobulin V-set domain-containing protein n=1 Tax=Paramormyrops kingsleyae TaxID=1676925 RepID=A0A3B3RVB7_9TELE